MDAFLKFVCAALALVAILSVGMAPPLYVRVLVLGKQLEAAEATIERLAKGDYRVGDIVTVEGEPRRIEYGIVGEYRLNHPIGKAPPAPYPPDPDARIQSKAAR